jgi:CIC family chloride channel protein
MPNKASQIIRKFLIWKYRHISEENFIYILSILVGFLAGIGAVILKNLTHYIKSSLNGNFTKNIHYSYYFIFPIIGLILVFLIKKHLLKREIGHGISTTLHAIARRNGIIKRVKIYASLLTAPITVGFGGSVGLQGPAVSTGAAIGSNIGLVFHLNPKKRMLLIGCATAGAMASMFKAPIAAVIFAVEIFSLELAFSSMIPLLLASISSVVTSYFFLGSDILFSFKLKDPFEIKDIVFFAFLGLVTGAASVYFSKMYFFIIKLFDRLKSPVSQLLVGGIAIGTLLYLVPPLFGEGYSLINNLLLGDHLAAIGQTPFDEFTDNIWVVILLLSGIVLFKAIAMTTTFAAGGVGGIFIPTLVMGSALGNVFAKIINNVGLGFHVSESNFTLLGMTGLMAGVLHAPLTAIFLIAEITKGYELFIPLMIVAAISFAFTRYFIKNSIYTSELAKKGQLITHDRDKNVLMLMKIDKVIETNFVCLFPEMKLGEMLNKAVAKSSRNNFPVINETGQLLGVVLLDDIRHMMFDSDMYDTVTVAKLMHSPPAIVFYEKDNMQKIMEKFKQTTAWNLPVVKEGKYMGFISKSRLLSSYRRKLIEVTN